jgi:hypothetical protein
MIYKCRTSGGLLLSERRPNCDLGEPYLLTNGSLFMEPRSLFRSILVYISHSYKPPLEDLFTQAIAVALGEVGEGAVDVPARLTSDSLCRERERRGIVKLVFGLVCYAPIQNCIAIGQRLLQRGHVTALGED